MPVSEYPDVALHSKRVQPYLELWSTAANWIEWHDHWMNGPMELIEFDKMRLDFEQAKKSMTKAKRIFSDTAPAMAKIATSIKAEIDEFAQITRNLDLVEAHVYPHVPTSPAI